jgi:hypothetical protein
MAYSRKNGLQAENQVGPSEVGFSGWNNHQNGKKCGNEAHKKNRIRRSEKNIFEKCPLRIYQPVIAF